MTAPSSGVLCRSSVFVAPWVRTETQWEPIRSNAPYAMCEQRAVIVWRKADMEWAAFMSAGYVYETFYQERETQPSHRNEVKG